MVPDERGLYSRRLNSQNYDLVVKVCVGVVREWLRFVNIIHSYFDDGNNFCRAP